MIIGSGMGKGFLELGRKSLKRLVSQKQLPTDNVTDFRALRTRKSFRAPRCCLNPPRCSQKQVAGAVIIGSGMGKGFLELGPGGDVRYHRPPTVLTFFFISLKHRVE